MAKIKSLEELKKLREQAQNNVSLRVKGDNIEKMIQIRVAMATVRYCRGRQGGHDGIHRGDGPPKY